MLAQQREGRGGGDEDDIRRQRRRNVEDEDELSLGNTQSLGLAAQAVALALTHLLSSLRTNMAPSRAPVITRPGRTTISQPVRTNRRDIEEEHEGGEDGDGEEEEDIFDEIGFYAVRYSHPTDDVEADEEESEETELSEDEEKLPELYDGDEESSENDYRYFQKPLR